MAIQQVNVYVFTVYLKSKKATNQHLGENVLAIGATPAAAQQVVQQQFAGDLTGTISGATLVKAGAYTSLA